MIVISRQLGQAVVIGDGIMVQIVEIGDNRVRLGVVAPPNCNVCKEEHLVTPDAVVHAEKLCEESP